MIIVGNRNAWLIPFICGIALSQGISIPFFSSFRQKQTTTTVPPSYLQLRDQRIINADHGGVGVPLLKPSYAGGNNPWISGTKDQYIRDQLVILHPDSPLNREAWKESGYLNPDFDPIPRKANNVSSPLTTTTKPNPVSSKSSSSSRSSNQLRARKLHRRPKQQQEHFNGQQPKTTSRTTTPVQQPTVGTIPEVGSNLDIFNFHPNNFVNSIHQGHPMPITNPGGGGLYEIPILFQHDINDAGNNHATAAGAPMIASAETILLHGNSLLIPITAQSFPYDPRSSILQQPQPPEAMIQFLKSPEQEISPLTRPQVKLPFPLSRDCSSGGGTGSSSKPLQFVVLPIVEPVAPLKPIFPKPSFLSSQYGQFPYIPPFNLFKKPPPAGLSQDPSNVGGGSGQFVPILNRPAPPLPFVFVQSLPLDLIGQNMEMDVIHSAAPTTTSENKIKEIPVPIAAPTHIVTQQPPVPPRTQPKPSPAPSPLVDNLPHPTRPLPLIVIEKVKTPGQPPSSPIAPAAAVVEITKQSIQKNNNNANAPLSTISVVQPITAPGSKPATLQQQREIQKAIEKLVPVAAAVLENVEQEQLKQQKEQGRDRNISNNLPKPPTPVTKEESAQPEIVPPPPSTTNNHLVAAASGNEPDKIPLRPSLRPQSNQSVGGIPPINSNYHFKKPDISSSEEFGIGVGPTTLSEVEVTEA